MTKEEILGLWEAYNQVYELDEERVPVRKRGGVSAPEDQRSIGGQPNRDNKDYWASVEGRNRDRGKGSEAARRAAKLNKEEIETDLFDVILEHLVAEGFADTNEAALAIMANMSEEWKQSIVEADSIAAMRARAAKRRKQRYGASDTSRGGRDDFRPYTEADYNRPAPGSQTKKED